MNEQALLSLGLWIKRRRKALDLTQEALATRVGCSKELIVKIEGDARRPSREIAALLATHLQLAPEEVDTFIRCARAELAPDRLPSPTRSLLRAAFPPRPPAAPPRSNLPAQLSSFLGRERELVDLRALLQQRDVRLVTLTGAGGTGKTRLALHAVAEERANFKDGVFFVDLAPISDPELVVAMIAQILGLMDAGSQPIRERLKAYVQTHELLVLLDNFEQVPAAAALVAELLAAAPNLKVLVTSRVPLHLSGEHEYAVLPLALPPTTDHRDSHIQAGMIGQYAAVQLFIQRAQAAKAGFVVTNANALAIAEICVRLDGLPLAIELAAARIKLFTPEVLLARLNHPLALLTGGPRDLPARQQTIRAAIDWSYTLLSADEQQLFRRLGVFVGGFTFEAAEVVGMANGDEMIDVLAVLSALVDHSLLTVLEPVAGEPRYGMLELVREYALEGLFTVGEDAETRQRHATYLLELAEVVGPNVGGLESHKALDRLEADLPNIRAAFTWARAVGEHELTLRFAGTLLPLWLEKGHRGEGSAMLQIALSRPNAGPPIARARALNALGRLGIRDGGQRYPERKAALEESLAIFRDLGDLDGSAEVLNHLAYLEVLRGDMERSEMLQIESLRDSRAAHNPWRTAWALSFLAHLAFLNEDNTRGSALLAESQALFGELKDTGGRANGSLILAWVAHQHRDDSRAVALLTESVRLLREGGQASSPAWTLLQLGWAQLWSGDYRRAADVLQESLAMYREMGEFELIPQVRNALGEAAYAGGDHSTARAYFQESRALCRELGNTWDEAGSLLGEGHVALTEGNYSAASACYIEALKCFASLPNWDERRRRTGTATCLEGLAGAVARTDPKRAARLCSAAAALRTTVGRGALQEFDLAYPLPHNPVAEDELAAVRSALGEEAFQAAWAGGQALTLEQTVAEAMTITDTAATLPAGTP